MQFNKPYDVLKKNFGEVFLFHCYMYNRRKCTRYLTRAILYKLTILMSKRNATIEFFWVRHEVHKHELHELTMTRTLSKAFGLFELHVIGLHEYFNCCHECYFLLSNLSKILHFAFLLPVSICFIFW